MPSFGIENGQVYIAADGGKYGHVVFDTSTYEYCDDVLTFPFTKDGFEADMRRIDAFKLARVRYSLVEGELPAWVPFMTDELRYKLISQ